MKCPIHPLYKGLYKPESKAEGCVCKQVYHLALLKRRLDASQAK